MNASERVASICNERKRRAVELRGYGGMTYQEIGTILGVSAKRARGLYLEGMADVGEKVCGFGAHKPQPMYSTWAEEVSELSVRARWQLGSLPHSKEEVAAMSANDLMAHPRINPKVAREVAEYFGN